MLNWPTQRIKLINHTLNIVTLASKLCVKYRNHMWWYNTLHPDVLLMCIHDFENIMLCDLTHSFTYNEVINIILKQLSTL